MFPIPMTDAILAPGLATTVVTIGPAVIGIAVALVVGVVFLARGASEELRRTAARDWEARRMRIEKRDRDAWAA